ncbi:MAG: ABC transporter ATP-binding protein [Planctomycetales bacterium]
MRDFETAAGKLRVLNGIDFEARAGELTMLVGPSGCGKTTLISIIAGLLTATEGEVHVFGQEVTALKGGRLVDFRLKNIGFIFQQFNLLAGLNAAENVAVPLVAAGLKWERALPRAEELLAKLDLQKHSHKIPQQLSGGQQQRVAIARALIHDPRLLLCDEPTASLDGHAGQAVIKLLRELAVKPDRAAVVVTHDPRIYDYADRIVHMEDGNISRVTQVK